MSLETSGDALILPHASQGKIGSILKRSGAASEHSIQLALRAQKDSRARLGDILSARGLAERADIAEAAAQQQGLKEMAKVGLTDKPPFDFAALRRAGVTLTHRIGGSPPAEYPQGATA